MPVDGHVDEGLVVEHPDEVQLVVEGEEHVLEAGVEAESLDGLVLRLDHLAVVGGGDVEIEVRHLGGTGERHAGFEVDDGGSDEAVQITGDVGDEVVQVFLTGHDDPSKRGLFNLR